MAKLIHPQAVKILWLLLVLSLLAACRTQPVYEAQNRPIRAPDNVTLELIGKVISEAGEVMGWNFKPGGENELIGSIQTRGGGRAVVSVKYSKTAYNIFYKDSLDLRYDGKTIHGAYNNAVRRLDNAIHLKLSAF